MFWSIRNHSQPELMHETNSGVTCLAFSNTAPTFLAVGLIDGTIIVFGEGRKIISVCDIANCYKGMSYFL